MGSILMRIRKLMIIRFARCVKQDGFYTGARLLLVTGKFARCVKQDGFYTIFPISVVVSTFARCVKQDGFYTYFLFLLW